MVFLLQKPEWTKTLGNDNIISGTTSVQIPATKYLYLCDDDSSRFGTTALEVFKKYGANTKLLPGARVIYFAKDGQSDGISGETTLNGTAAYYRNIIRQVFKGKFSPNTWYTISCYVWTSTNDSSSEQLLLLAEGYNMADASRPQIKVAKDNYYVNDYIDNPIAAGNYACAPNVLVNGDGTPINTKQWNRVSLSFKTSDAVNENTDMYIMFRLINTKTYFTSGSTKIAITAPKLEMAKRPSPWTDTPVNINKLLATGIDIEHQKITLTSDNFEVQNNSGEKTLGVDKTGGFIVQRKKTHFSPDGNYIMLSADQQAILMRGGANEGTFNYYIEPIIGTDGYWYVNGNKTTYKSISYERPCNGYDDYYLLGPYLKTEDDYNYWWDIERKNGKIVPHKTTIKLESIKNCSFILKNRQGYGSSAAYMEFSANDGSVYIDGTGIQAGEVSIHSQEGGDITTPKINLLYTSGSSNLSGTLYVSDGHLYFSSNIVGTKMIV